MDYERCVTSRDGRAMHPAQHGSRAAAARGLLASKVALNSCYILTSASSIIIFFFFFHPRPCQRCTGCRCYRLT